MSRPSLVADTSDVEVTATRTLTHLCPHVDETDHGHIDITWRVEGKTYELHSLGDYLDGYKDARLSHEEITDRIAHDLTAPGLTLIAVTTRWQTAGMEVTCSTSPIPAGRP